MAARQGRAVEWHSILLGVAVLKIVGLKPLLETSVLSIYSIRLSDRNGNVPITGGSGMRIDTAG